MAKPSPGAQRVLSILNHYAERPESAYTLSELVRALELNRATCHSLLAELVDAEYLLRNERKQYMVGPALAGLARIALQEMGPVSASRMEMRAIARAHDCICSTLHRDGPDVVVHERVTPVSLSNMPTARDSRWPLRPPFGSVFFVWSNLEGAEAWLDSLHPQPSPSERQRTREGIAFTREHGFQFVFRVLPDRLDMPFAKWLFSPDVALRPLQVGTSLDMQADYKLESLMAPVFNPAGSVEFAIGLSGFSKIYRGVEIAAMGAQLIEACQRVSRFVLPTSAHHQIPA